MALLCASWGCSSFDGGNDVLPGVQSLQTASQNQAPGTDWSCLGSPVTAAPVVVAESQSRIVYSFQVVDITTRQVPKGMKARPCVLTDVDCTQPVGPWVDIDDQGWFDVTLFQGYVGYIELVSDNSVPSNLYVTDALNGSSTLGFPLLSVSTDSLAALASIIGIELQPGLGLISVRAFDCQGVTAPDVVLSKAGAGNPWYFVNGLPTSTATKTSEDGLGGYANVPPGMVAVDLTTPTGMSIAGQRGFVVRPNQFSALFVGPRGVQLRSSPSAPRPSTMPSSTMPSPVR